VVERRWKKRKRTNKFRGERGEGGGVGEGGGEENEEEEVRNILDSSYMFM